MESETPTRTTLFVSDRSQAVRLPPAVAFGNAAAHTADIRANLERRGLPIGAYDVMIAGHARSRGLVVVTGNPREFDRVEGLRSEDWLIAAA